MMLVEVGQMHAVWQANVNTKSKNSSRKKHASTPPRVRTDEPCVLTSYASLGRTDSIWKQTSLEVNGIGSEQGWK